MLGVPQLYMYSWSVALQRKVLALSVGSVYTLSSIGAVVRPPLAGASHTGALVACRILPAASLSWNFAGTVLPALKMLVVVLAVCAVSLIGCSHRCQIHSSRLHCSLLPVAAQATVGMH